MLHSPLSPIVRHLLLTASAQWWLLSNVVEAQSGFDASQVSLTVRGMRFHFLKRDIAVFANEFQSSSGMVFLGSEHLLSDLSIGRHTSE